MTEGKGKIIPIGKLREHRERRTAQERLKASRRPPDSIQSEPTKGRGGYQAAVAQYRDALHSGDLVAQEAAAREIYRHRGNKGANVIAGLRIRHAAAKRAETKSKLKLIKLNEEN